MDLFSCRHFACRLTPGACIARQEKAWTTASINEVSSLAFAPCADCAQGRKVRAKLEQSGRLDEVKKQSEQLRTARNKAFWRRMRAKPAAAAGSTTVPQQPKPSIERTTPAPAAVATKEKKMKPKQAAPVVEPPPVAPVETAPAAPASPVEPPIEQPPTERIRWRLSDLSDEQLADLADVVGAEAERRESFTSAAA